MSNSIQNLKINELSIDKIRPSMSSYTDPTSGGSKIVVIGKPGCFAIGTEVLSYTGVIKKVEDVKVGDQLMGDDSTPRNVLELCSNNDMMYKITPTDGGSSYTVNEQHILSLMNISTHETVDIVLKDFLEKPESFKNDHLWYRTGAEFTPHNYLIDPYILGYWLVNNDTIKHMENIIPDDIKYQFLGYLQDHLLHKNKYIPNTYKINSSSVRLRLLAGIIDSNGSYDHDENTINISSVSEKLSNDIIFLAKSLGLFAYKKQFIFKNNIQYTCFISGNLYTINSNTFINLFKARANTPYNSGLTTPFTIEKLKHDKYYGFVLDNNHRFLLHDFSVAHNTGKTTLISSILYEKRNIFPVGMVMSGTEDSNGFYRKMFPSTFVYNKLEEDKIQEFIKRQKIAKKHLKNPWAVLLLDDCTDDPKLFNKPLFQGLYKNGRHWACLYILSLQYCMDIKPVIRTNIDGTFILRETNLKNRKALWENYAGVIPDFTMFCDIMDQLTDDYTALYIHNTTQSNKIEDSVFYYKAKPIPKDFKFGCPDFWAFHQARYNPAYLDSVI